MRILVTGAGGFAGRHLVASLLEKGFDVAAHSRRPVDPSNGHARLTRYTGDLSEGIPAVGALDAIVHCASRNRLPPASPSTYLKDNVRALENLLVLAGRKKAAKFIFLSSVSVYGRIEVPVLDEAHSLNYDTDFGLSKLVCERLLAEASDDVMSAMGLRLPAIIGREAHHVWLARLRDALVKGEAVEIQNPQALHNNLLHVDDLCTFVLRLVADVRWRGWDAVNLAVEDSLSVMGVAELLRKALGSSSVIRVAEATSFPYTISTDKARRLYGFRSQTITESLTRFAREA